MSERILFPQFRDEQEDSRYPFADSATLVSTENRLEIGRDTFIDASIYTINGERGAYLASIVVTLPTITINIGDSGVRSRASVTYDALNPPSNGILTLTDALGRPAGMLLSTPLALARFAAWPVGTHSFRAAATEFVSSVVIPAKEPGVRALTTEDGGLFTDDVWLVGDAGVVVREESANVIRIDIVGNPLFLRALCTPISRFQTKRFVKTINGCGPDEYGNFTLTATGHGVSDTVLRIYPVDGNIKIDTVGRKVV